MREEGSEGDMSGSPGRKAGGMRRGGPLYLLIWYKVGHNGKGVVGIINGSFHLWCEEKTSIDR